MRNRGGLWRCSCTPIVGRAASGWTATQSPDPFQPHPPPPPAHSENRQDAASTDQSQSHVPSGTYLKLRHLVGERSMPEEADLETAPPATFKGRLHLDSFKYIETPSTTTSPRRSPRRSATSPATRNEALHHANTTPEASPSKPSASPIADRKKRLSGRRSSSSSSTPPRASPGRRKRSSAGYAPPSTYAHLPPLPDALAPNLLVLFVGLNPGIQTARTGHAYAHPSNLFWKLLFSSGITPRPCRADEDREMPALYSLGNTNIVSRPSRNGAELSKREMDEGVCVLEEKARTWRPETMCVVGKSIWESIWRVRHGRPVGAAFRYGWQDESENLGAIEGEWPGARVFVASSTSGLAASLSPAEKQAIWAPLGAWVQKRRAEREKDATANSCGSENFAPT
ncbi:hypothetical protein HIM_09067 [Hirsutella minnesotensis 3608]|uniref:Uracil-DNA glycosylase-like domain-containing protein n=1 Tax=Hirsutella minnesotensis 3608 TaxID=1043627 RepID=A0A0F8A3B3_9HYPO|nr:hypothetical protein HIM_09067 [Hirsutella minnesotensis 3608]